ncbi:MAG TPA: HAD family hydrolase [Candidatus Saccharimonadales bacterium]|nr:HAD family hydrolase [Candidatus Saccharimonadales bacterium]
MTVRAVVFDVGETLIDETRAWSAWADALGVPRLTLFGVLGGVIARGGSHREPFELLRPDADIGAMLRDPATASLADFVQIGDFYPDAVPALQALVAAGYRVGIAGNQPSRTEAMLRDLDVELALIGSSATFGVAKPDPAFFERIVATLDLPAGDVAYVGDRLDNDVRPARAVGLVTVFIRRGPWAWLQAGRTDPPEADLVIDGLPELPAALSRLG